MSIVSPKDTFKDTFKDLITVNKKTLYKTYKEAAMALGLIEDDE